jgi:hypothetical protein
MGTTVPLMKARAAPQTDRRRIVKQAVDRAEDAGAQGSAVEVGQRSGTEHGHNTFGGPGIVEVVDVGSPVYAEHKAQGNDVDQVQQGVGQEEQTLRQEPETHGYGGRADANDHQQQMVISHAIGKGSIDACAQDL